MLTFDKQDAIKIVRGKHAGFDIIEDEFIRREKDVDLVRIVIQDKQNKKCYEKYFHHGFKPVRAGRGYYVLPCEWEEPIFKEVDLREVVVKKWVGID